MALLAHTSNGDQVMLPVNGEMVIPPRDPSSPLPKLTVIAVVRDKQTTNTVFWPAAGSVPSTRHPKTIRFINLDWDGVKVKVEYDDSSKVLKVLSGNVDSVVIGIR